MTAPRQELQISVVGSQAVAADLDDAESESGHRLAAATTSPEGLPDGSPTADCLLLDAPAVDSWRSVLDELAGAASEVPVVVVAADAFESAVEAAAAAGAADYLPRSLCDRRPSLVATRLATVADGEGVTPGDSHDPGAGNDSEASDDPGSETGDDAAVTRSNGEDDARIDSEADQESDGEDDARIDREADREIDGTYRELFESVSDGLVIHEPETGEILDCNSQFCEMTGYGRGELIGKSVGRVVPTAEEYSYERARERIRRTTDEGPQLFEWRGRRKGGETYPVEVHLDQARIGGRERVIASVRNITERKRRKREYEQIFNGVNDAIAVHDPDTGDLLAVNDRFQELTGYDRERLFELGAEGLTVPTETITPEDIPEIIRRVSEGAEVDPYEQAIETAGGDRRWLEVNPTHAVIDGKERFLAISRDVTERRERQQRLAAARDRRAVLFDNSPDPIVTVTREDGQPHIIEVNSAFEETFGFDAEAVLGRALSEVVVPEERQERHGRLRDRALSGDTLEAEVRRQTADGMRDFLLRVLPYESDDDSRAYVWYTDITERRERERALERERDRRSVLFENNPDPVLGLEFEGADPIIREVNPAFEAVFGYDAEGVVGSTVAETVVPESERDQHDKFRKLAAKGETIEHEAPRQTADGVRQFIFRVIQFNDEPGTTDAYVWYTDVTERRRHEQAIEALQAATGRMQGAETAEAVASIAVEAARDALDLPVTGCWLHDDETGRLDPVAATDAAREQGLWRPITPDCAAYDRFEADEMRQYTPTDGAAEFGLDGLLLPLGEYGLLAAGHDGSEYDDVILDVAGTLAEQTETALARLDRAQEVRESQQRLQAIIDRIDEAIFIAPASELDAVDVEPEFVSSGYEAIWGEPLERIHQRHEEGFFGTIHPDDYDGYVALIRRVMAEIEDGDPADSYSREYRIERPDGEVRWVHSDFYPIEWTEGPRRVVIVSRDVTDRKQRDRAVESFHDATAELTTADTVADASRLAVTAAANVFELPATAVYHYDDATATLEPRATGPALADPADLSPLTADDSQAWEAFIDDGMDQITADASSPLAAGPSSDLLVFPLGGNGLLAVWKAGETFDTDAASILAATLEAALNRLRGERQLETRRAELAAQTERAQRLEAVTELTQRVEAAITTATSRAGIQEAVCTELVGLDPFEGAWIAAAEVGTDRLTPRATAGVGGDHVEGVLDTGGADPPGGTDPHPAVEAWRTGEPRVVTDLVASGRRGGWRQYPLKEGVGAVCAVPLAYSGITYGVLTILAADPDGFGDRELGVLEQLSRSIGYAITAIERRRALESDDTVELEFEGQGMALPFAELAREADCQVHHERTVRRQDGSVSVYYSLRGSVPDDPATVAGEQLPGEVTVVSEHDGETVVERQGSSWFGSLLSEHGGVLRQGRATPTGVTLLVELPREADVRTIVERLQTALPALELTAKRQHRETAATPRDVKSRLQQRLTDRQYEALETGHAMGYFEWPREHSGEEVAERLGITQPTVNKHIRLGERKVFDFLFDTE